ncbi:MAG: cobalt-precorrin 5A hydrolase [Clostridia bacterium]|nr:cobalt-precorrin 5A hydrolase [Clostridia bacterium]
MKLALLSFSQTGKDLADRIARKMGGVSERCLPPVTLTDWTREQFVSADALVFVGAAGIAVRAIAPYVKDKATDPAVLVIDERGSFVIPILSGHLGGANSLARILAEFLGATPVITTATDVNGKFAIDDWARVHHCAVVNKGAIQSVSGKLLAGNEIRLASKYPISGTVPSGVVPVKAYPYDVYVGVHTPTVRENVLWLVPKIGVMGIGCKKGTPESAIRFAVHSAFREWSISRDCIAAVATIDLKKEEPGLCSYVEQHGWEFQTFSAEELKQVPGHFQSSAFVARTVGVDNVCERSAVLGSGGELIGWKTTFGGVTVALAARPFAPDWEV